MRIYLLLLVMGVLILSACSNSKKLTGNDAVAQTIPYSIIIGSGGGFAGNYEGLFLDSVGVIYKWSGNSFYTAVLIPIDTLNNDNKDLLTKYLNKNDLKDERLKQTGNIITFVTLKNYQEENTFSWSGKNIPEEASTKIKDFYDFTIKVLKNNK